MKSQISISPRCWAIARKKGYGQLMYPSRIENTGQFSLPGQWWLDRKNARIIISSPIDAEPPIAAVVKKKKKQLKDCWC